MGVFLFARKETKRLSRKLCLRSERSEDELPLSSQGHLVSPEQEIKAEVAKQRRSNPENYEQICNLKKRLLALLDCFEFTTQILAMTNNLKFKHKFSLIL